MAQNIEEILSKAFGGHRCSVIRREFDWVFFFDDYRALVLTAPWRVVLDDKIAFADADHDQKFGHPEPIDGAA